MYSEMALAHVMNRRNRGNGGLDPRAVRLFERVVRDPRPNPVKRLFGKRVRPLRRLADRTDAARFANRRQVGLQTVTVEAIHGTLGREWDFDYDFRPLQQSDAGRWSQIATAMLNGVDMPPIELIQIGAEFYVKDGHHRVSVARALGFRYLDAFVEVWSEPGSGA